MQCVFCDSKQVIVEVIGTKTAVNVVMRTRAMCYMVTERWADTVLRNPQKFCVAVSLLFPAGCYSTTVAQSSSPNCFSAEPQGTAPACLTIRDKCSN